VSVTASVAWPAAWRCFGAGFSVDECSDGLAEGVWGDPLEAGIHARGAPSASDVVGRVWCGFGSDGSTNPEAVVATPMPKVIPTERLLLLGRRGVTADLDLPPAGPVQRRSGRWWTVPSSRPTGRWKDLTGLVGRPAQLTARPDALLSPGCACG
jgi:hypothetical protein